MAHRSGRSFFSRLAAWRPGATTPDLPARTKVLGARVRNRALDVQPWLVLC